MQVQGKKEMAETFRQQILLKIDNSSSVIQRNENDDKDEDQDGGTSENEEREDDISLYYNSPTAVPEITCQNSRIIRDLSRRISTLETIPKLRTMESHANRKSLLKTKRRAP